MSRQTGARSKEPTRPSLGLRSQATSNYVFGVGKELPPNRLPKTTDVIKYKYLLKDRNATLSELAIHGLIFSDLAKIWKRADIPIREKKSIIDKISAIFDTDKTYLAILKDVNKPALRDKSTLEKYKRDKLSHFDVLFDIAKCKCFSKATTIDQMVPSKCKCTKTDKIPDLKFYFDQKTRRIGQIWNTSSNHTNET